MPTLLRVQSTNGTTALVPVFTAVLAGGHRLEVSVGSADWTRGGALLFWMRNTNGVAVTATWVFKREPAMTTPIDTLGEWAGPYTFTAGAGESRLFGPINFPLAVPSSTPGGFDPVGVDITYSATTGLSVAVLDPAALVRR